MPNRVKLARKLMQRREAARPIGVNGCAWLQPKVGRFCYVQRHLKIRTFEIRTRLPDPNITNCSCSYFEMTLWSETMAGPAAVAPLCRATSVRARGPTIHPVSRATITAATTRTTVNSPPSRGTEIRMASRLNSGVATRKAMAAVAGTPATTSER